MQLLTPKEAAEMIGVSLTTIKTWMSRPQEPLPSVQVGDSGKHRRIVGELVQPWLSSEAQRKAKGTK